MRQERASPDAVVAKVAARQHGVVSFEQLVAAGVSPSGVSRRVRAGRLHRVFHGVYAVGHAGLGSEGRWSAAVLACGNGAVLSHRSAAALWELLSPRPGSVDVSVPGQGGRRKRPGIRLHRSPSLTDAVTTRRKGIAVTTPPRTIRDLRRVAAPEQLRRAVRQAEVLGLRLGEGAADRTRSELEHNFLRMCRRHRLPAPEVNVRIDRFEVDFLWRERRLIVETDGYRYHRGRAAFESDHERDVQLKLLGYDVVRFTYRQVTEDPRGVVATLRRLLK